MMFLGVTSGKGASESNTSNLRKSLQNSFHKTPNPVGLPVDNAGWASDLLWWQETTGGVVTNDA
jgi:hypothetical protein